MAGVFITTRIRRSGKPRYVVRFRMGGRSAPVQHAGVFDDRDTAELYASRLRHDIAAGRIAEPRREPREDERLVYFGRVGPLVKIGISFRPGSRCSSLGAELLATEQGGRRREEELHRRFHRHHVRAEWFEASPEILEYVRRLIARAAA